MVTRPLTRPLSRGLSWSTSGRRNGAAEPVVFAPRKAILDGDSLSSSQIWSVSATNTERRASGYFTNAAAQLFQMFDLRFAQGFGQSGNKIEDILSSQATAISYMEANDVPTVFLHLGTNDVENTAVSVATLTADYQTCLENYLNASTTPDVILGLPFPRGDWEADLEATRATYVQRLHDIRAALTTLVNTTINSPRLKKWDAWDDVVDVTVFNPTTGLNYFPKAGFMNTDGVHLLPKAAHWAGKRCAAVVRTFDFWAEPTELPDNTGLINTATYDLAGTAGTKGTGVTGDVATGCRVERASGSPTVTCSKETTDVCGISMECQKIVIAGASATGEEVFFYADYPEKTGASYAFPGSVGLEMVVPIKISAINQMDGVYLYARVDVGSMFTCKDMAFVSGDSLSVDDAPYNWLLRTEPIAITAGNPTRQQCLVRMRVNGTVGGSGATIYIGKPFYRQATP